MRFVCWFMSFMVVIASTQSAYAASPVGWSATPSSVLMDGATATINAVKGAGSSAMSATIAYKPTASAVGKQLLKGGGSAAIAFALVELADGAIDWLLDPANNAIEYKNPNYGGASGTNSNKLVWRAEYNADAYFPTADAACRAGLIEINNDRPAGQKFTYVSASTSTGVCKYKDYDRSAFTLPLTSKQNPDYVAGGTGNSSKEYLSIPIDTVAAKVIANADAAHAPSQEFLKAVAVGAVESGDLDAPLDAVAESAVDTDTPTDPANPVDPAKPFDDSGIIGWLKKILASISGLWVSFAEFAGFMNSDLPPEKTDTSVDVAPPAVPTKSANDFDVDYISFGGQCPVMPSSVISVGVVSVPLSFNMTPLCDLANAIRPAVLAIAYFVGLGVVASAIRET